MSTVVFKNKPAVYQHIQGFTVCNTDGREIGVVWSHKHKKGELSEGQAEIRFYDHVSSIYHKWQLVFINGERYSFYQLSKRIRSEGELTLTIDPWQGRGKVSTTNVKNEGTKTTKDPSKNKQLLERESIDVSAFQSIGTRVKYLNEEGTITARDFPYISLTLDNGNVKKVDAYIAVKNKCLTLA